MNISKNIEEIQKMLSEYRIPFKLQDEWVKEATFDIGKYVMKHYIGGKVVGEYPIENHLHVRSYINECS